MFLLVNTDQHTSTTNYPKEPLPNQHDAEGNPIINHATATVNKFTYIISSIRLNNIFPSTFIYPVLLLVHNTTNSQDDNETNQRPYSIQCGILIGSTIRDKEELTNTFKQLKQSAYHTLHEAHSIQGNSRGSLQEGFVDLQYASEKDASQTYSIPFLAPDQALGSIKCVSNDERRYNLTEEGFSFLDDPYGAYFLTNEQITTGLSAGVSLYCAVNGEALTSSELPRSTMSSLPYAQFEERFTKRMLHQMHPNDETFLNSKPLSLLTPQHLFAVAVRLLHALLENSHTSKDISLQAILPPDRAFYINYYQKLAALTQSSEIQLHKALTQHTVSNPTTVAETTPSYHAKLQCRSWLFTGCITTFFCGAVYVPAALLLSSTNTVFQKVVIEQQSFENASLGISQMLQLLYEYIPNTDQITQAMSQINKLEISVQSLARNASALANSPKLQIILDTLTTSTQILLDKLASTAASIPNTTTNVTSLISQTLTIEQRLSNITQIKEGIFNEINQLKQSSGALANTHASYTTWQKAFDQNTANWHLTISSIQSNAESLAPEIKSIQEINITDSIQSNYSLANISINVISISLLILIISKACLVCGRNRVEQQRLLQRTSPPTPINTQPRNTEPNNTSDLLGLMIDDQQLQETLADTRGNEDNIAILLSRLAEREETTTPQHTNTIQVEVHNEVNRQDASESESNSSESTNSTQEGIELLPADQFNTYNEAPLYTQPLLSNEH